MIWLNNTGMENLSGKASFTIKDIQGDEVYTGQLQKDGDSFFLEVDEAYSIVWGQVDRSGKQVPQGRYEIFVSFVLDDNTTLSGDDFFFIIEPKGEYNISFLVSTDKLYYEQRENITIIVTNTGEYDLTYPHMPLDFRILTAL